MKSILVNTYLEILTAVQYFTRIPVPEHISLHYNQDLLNRSRTYFPAIGILIAGIFSGSFLVLQEFFSTGIAVILSMAIGILSTGAFHEDGFADVCDGFGGGYTKEHILSIMKDSRLGTYGSVGLIFILGIKFICLYELASIDSSLLITTLFFSHITSRFFANMASNLLDYVREDETAKSKPIARTKLSFLRLGLGFVFVLISSFHLLNPYLVLSFIPGWLVCHYLVHYFKKYIGGFTGDCLGSIQQVTEVILYLSVLGIWNYYPIYGNFISIP